MTAAQDRLVRARAEAAAAEEMGSPEVDVALAAVEQAEQEVADESEYMLRCRVGGEEVWFNPGDPIDVLAGWVGLIEGWACPKHAADWRALNIKRYVNST